MEPTRKKLFNIFFDHHKIKWERTGDSMEFRIDNGLFIIDDFLDSYDWFLKQYGFPKMQRISGTRFLCDGIIALVCRVQLYQFATQINSIRELSEWERSKFVLATKDPRIISNKLLRLPSKDQTTSEIEDLLKRACSYRLAKNKGF